MNDDNTGGSPRGISRKWLAFAAVLIMLAGVAALILSAPVDAQERPQIGDDAPMFTAQGALAGKPFALDLARELKKGPVVLYFYPKAFTEGCTLEANAFAEASDDFAAAGAQVFGMSADDIGTLSKFSTEECRDKFAVASASSDVIEDYGVDLAKAGVSTGLTTRTSFVIAPEGRIAFVHDEMNYKDHVRLTLEAARRLSGGS